MKTRFEPREPGYAVAAILARTAMVIVAALAAGCGGDSTGPPEERIVSVEITSPVDTIMAAGRSAPLTAAARDSRGAAVTGVAFSWSSSNEDVATVSSAGVVQAAGSGSTTISAVTASVTGSLNLRVADIDLDEIVALLADPYASALVASLAEASRSGVQGAIADCDRARDAGHVIAMSDCLADIAGEAVAATGATDRVLGAVLGVFARSAELLLSL